MNNSKKPDPNLPEEMHGWRFDELITLPLIATYGCPYPLQRASNLEQYLYERCRRAESGQVAQPKQYTEE